MPLPQGIDANFLWNALSGFGQAAQDPFGNPILAGLQGGLQGIERSREEDRQEREAERRRVLQELQLQQIRQDITRGDFEQQSRETRQTAEASLRQTQDAQRQELIGNRKSMVAEAAEIFTMQPDEIRTWMQQTESPTFERDFREFADNTLAGMVERGEQPQGEGTLLTGSVRGAREAADQKRALIDQQRLQEEDRQLKRANIQSQITDRTRRGAPEAVSGLSVSDNRLLQYLQVQQQAALSQANSLAGTDDSRASALVDLQRIQKRMEGIVEHQFPEEARGRGGAQPSRARQRPLPAGSAALDSLLSEEDRPRPASLVAMIQQVEALGVFSKEQIEEEILKLRREGSTWPQIQAKLTSFLGG